MGKEDSQEICKEKGHDAATCRNCCRKETCCVCVGESQVRIRTWVNLRIRIRASWLLGLEQRYDLA